MEIPSTSLSEVFESPTAPNTLVESPSLPRSSTPTSTRQASLSAPSSKRLRLNFTIPLPTITEVDESEADTTQIQVFTSELNASSLADTYLTSNPSSAHNAEETGADDISNEPNSIEYVRAKLLKGCKCSKKCFNVLAMNEIQIYHHRLNVIGMSKLERDMLVMANVEVGVHEPKKSTRKRITYRYHNIEVCIDTFLFLFAITEKYVKMIRKWYHTNGLISRVHGNAGHRPRHGLV